MANKLNNINRNTLKKKKAKTKNKPKTKKKTSLNIRFNILNVLVYLVGIIFLIQLFNLQIINGDSYRQQSNNRLSRQSTIKSTRGSILDCSGNELVTSDVIFNLELYKTKTDSVTFNNSLLDLIDLMDRYEIKYEDNLPINIDDMSFTISDQKLETFLKDNKFDEDTTAEKVFYKLKDKYEIENTNIEEVYKIMKLRYEISRQGYSQTNGVVIAKDIPREAVNELNESSEKYPGINITQTPIRVYPNGEMASHILGYASKISAEAYSQNKDTYKQDDIIGKAGVEYVFEKYLKGTDGKKNIEMSIDGTIMDETTQVEAVAGSNVVLTIDSNLQRITEEQLAQNIEKIRDGGFGKVYDAQGGVAVVMNVKTGEILSMASYPNYDPSKFTSIYGISQEDWDEYNNSKLHPLVNKVTQSAYSPGSTFKMITALAGLETGIIDKNTTINDTGTYTNHGVNMKCWYYTSYHTGHGPLNVIGAIEKSCNYFFYTLADQMGITTLAKFSRYFGLGGKTGIELPYEINGFLASEDLVMNGEKVTIYPGDVLNAGIGQGYNSFTPIQMVQYISMLANNGKHVSPTILKSIQRQDGTEVPKSEIEEYLEQALGFKPSDYEDLEIDPENLNIVLQGMKNVTSDSGGTASERFRDFGITVGGKTGSAEAGKDENGNDITHAWFVGFAPFEDPEIAVVVMVENGGHGNYTAEAVREIMREYFGMNTIEVQEDISANNYVQEIR